MHGKLIARVGKAMGICALVGAATGLVAVTAVAATQTPVGRWKTIDDNTGKAKSIVRIWEKDGKLFGKIEKLFLEPTEDQNPLCNECTGKKKDKPIIGMTILWDLERDDDEWSDGTILDPENGETYSCYVEVVEGGKKLKVRGYVGFSLLGRTQYWLAVPAPAG